MKKRFSGSWRRLFLSMAAISVLFTAVVLVANGGLFTAAFTAHEKRVLRSAADAAAAVDVNDRAGAEEALRALEEGDNVQFSLYEGETLIYASLRQFGPARPGLSGFDLLVRSEDQRQIADLGEDGEGGRYTEVTDGMGVSYLVYTRTYDTRTVEAMIPLQIIEAGSGFATRFTLVVMTVALLVVLIVNVWLSLRFTRPITEINDVARQMTRLDFSRKAAVRGKDELAELAGSLNAMSDSLDAALRELQEKNARLEDEIEERRRLDEMRSGFVANVSHELKTPLAILQGYAEALEDGADDPARRERYCRVIREETERMHGLVLRLLELSRYESGAAVSAGPVDLTACAANVVDRLCARLEEKKVVLSFDLPERLPAEGDPVMLEQAVENYLSNAISHVPEGGEIRLFTEPYGEKERLCVYNAGSHVAPEDLENVWQSFFRADKSHNRAEGRFGLGLSIVRAILVAHRADFGVYNTEDGVVFWMEIPRAQ